MNWLVMEVITSTGKVENRKMAHIKTGKRAWVSEHEPSFEFKYVQIHSTGELKRTELERAINM